MKPDAQPNPGDYLLASQAARELGISRQRVHQLAKSGRLRSLKSGHNRLISITDLEAFKRLNRQPGPRLNTRE